MVECVLSLRIGDRRHEAAVAGREIVELVEHARQPLDGGLHLDVLRILRQRPSERLIGTFRIVETDLVAVGDLLEERNPLLRIGRVPRLDLVDCVEPRPVPADLVDGPEQLCDVELVLWVRQDPLERRDGLRVLGLDLQDLRVGLDRRAQLIEPLFAQRAQASQESDRLRRIVPHQSQLALQIVGQLPELTPSEIETIERAQRPHTAGIVLQDHVPRDNGLLRVPQHLLPDGGDARPDFVALRHIGDELCLLEQGVDQIAPPLGAGVKPLERDQRRRILGLDALRAAEILDGAIRVSELLVVGHCDHQQEFSFQRRRQFFLPFAGERLFVERHQLLRGVEDVGQSLQRFARRQRRRIFHEGARVRLPGLIGVPELPFQFADPEQQIDALIGLLFVRELDSLNLDQSRGVAGRLVDGFQHLDRSLLQVGVVARQIRLQRGPRPDVRGFEAQRLAVRRHRASAVVQVLFENGAAAELELRDPGRVGRSGQKIDFLLNRGRQILPASELLIEMIERDQRWLLRRILL